MFCLVHLLRLLK